MILKMIGFQILMIQIELESLQGSDDERRSKMPPKTVRQQGDRPVIDLELGHEFSNLIMNSGITSKQSSF